MNDSTAVDIVVGSLLPFAIALVNQRTWSPVVKGAVALAVCFVSAAIAESIRGDLDWHDWRNTVIVITGATLVSYHTFWKPSTVAPVVEDKTTVVGRHAA